MGERILPPCGVFEALRAPPARNDECELKMRRLLKTCIKLVMLAYSSVAALALIILVVSAFAQVFGRYVLNASPSWSEELARFAFIWCSSLGAACALDKGGHAAITVLGDHLPRGAERILRTAMTVVILAVSVLVMVMGWRLAAATGKLASPAMHLPMSYVNIAICFCGAGMTLSSIGTLVELVLGGEPEEEKGGAEE